MPASHAAKHQGAVGDDVARLYRLAADSQSTARAGLYGAVAQVFHKDNNRFSATERTLICEILRQLTFQVEMSVRHALAEQLATDESAPHELILMLANDQIEVARPVLAGSPVLTGDDLFSLVSQTSQDHQAAVATRPDLPAAVVNRLADSESDVVLQALAANTRAPIGEAAMARLVERSRGRPAVQEPLLRRTDLPNQLAGTMYVWVSDSLRQYILDNFEVDARTIAQAMSAAVQTAANRPADKAEASPARRLVDKLASAGQLRAGFLLKALHQGQMDLFEEAFARLLGTDPARARNIIFESGAKGLALACRAVGIDRSVFMTIFNMTRAAAGHAAILSAAERAEADRIFAGRDRSGASSELFGAGS